MSNLQRIKIGFNVAMGGDPVCLYNEPSSIPLDHIEDANGNTISYSGGRYFDTVDGLNEFTYFLTDDTIGHNAFSNIGENGSPVVSIYIYGGVHNLGSYAFAVGNIYSQVTAITLEEGVEKIGYNDFEPLTGRTFETIDGVSAITIPSTVNEIGCNAFYNFNGATFTFCGATPTFDMSENGDLGNNTTVYVPAAYLNDYQTALSAYMPNIFPYGDAPADDILTNLNIKAAYVGADEVVKMYLGNDVVWEPEPCSKYEEGTQERCECEGKYWWGGECHDEPEPDPCEGLTGESLCNCQGRYWWGGECHDEPDTMPTTPLTFEITGVGTGETGSIGLRLSGDTGWANRRKLTYYLTHEGTETSGNLMLNEAVSNSAITSSISGLTVGDKIEFWGYSDQSGMSVSTSAFEYFVTTAGLTAKVYGNVNSLLFAGSFYHGQPVPQTGETAAYAFYKLFQNKTGFTFGAPDELQHIVLPVPANGLQDSIYREMFYGCTNMTTAPELPATTLAASCYRSMFNGAGLTTAPELPATTMADYAYLSMFADCPITQAPALPATTLAQNCYSNMFRGTNITDMPNLPATTLAQYCYQGMFSGCTSLTGVTAELPATTLASYCYQYMFQGCTSLTSAPALPATTLANSCYYGMFQDCTSLTSAPELPATTLAGNYCYGYMFGNCTLLNYVKALATNSGIRFNLNWLADVASNGTFVKHPDATWTSGVSGIPRSWTVEDADV